MTTVLTSPTPAVAAPTVAGIADRGPSRLTALTVLARRRLALCARTPRELIVPIMTPVLFAVVIAPALADTFGTSVGGFDYMTFVAVSTIGLLVPLSCMSAGLSVVVDRESGARRDLLSAPVSRSVIVFGNLVVALILSGLQLLALVGAAVARGADFDVRPSGVLWFAGAAVGFAVFYYGVAEIVANKIPSQEEYFGATPGIAIVPWFFAGSLFPIAAMPVGLTAIAKVLPITHVLALFRYGVADHGGQGLHDIWGMDDSTTMAALSLGVIAVSAAAMVALSIRVFRRASVT